MPSTDLADLHPWLRERVERVVAAYPARVPGCRLRLTCTHRTVAEQRDAHARGASQRDGVTTHSLHQWAPALAVDVVVVGPKGPVWEPWSLYERYGELGGAEGLTWGGRWVMRDGPHLEVPERERLRLAQGVLQHLGLYGGALDGLDGPRTQAGLRQVQADHGLRLTGRLDRATWARLHGVDPATIP